MNLTRQLMFAFSCSVSELNLKQQQALGLVGKAGESRQSMLQPLLPKIMTKHYKFSNNLCRKELFNNTQPDLYLWNLPFYIADLAMAQVIEPAKLPAYAHMLVWNACTLVLFSHKKEQNYVICRKMGRADNSHVKQNNYNLKINTAHFFSYIISML